MVETLLDLHTSVLGEVGFHDKRDREVVDIVHLWDRVDLLDRVVDL